MLATSAEARVALTTFGSREEAERVGRRLVEERLAACATVMMGGARSIYRWQGAVEEAEETLVLLKSTRERLTALEARLRELHSYETPEFLVLTVESASAAYGQWLEEAVRPA